MSTAPKGISKLINIEFVDSIDDERACGNGYWIYLKPGYINMADGIHMIHELTVRDVLIKMKAVGVCHCEQCMEQL